MIFKGHFNLLLPPLHFNKLTISSEDKKQIKKEYFYKEDKVVKIIDYINDIYSEYDYVDDGNYSVKFYLFEESVNDKKIDSIKKFTLNENKIIKEDLIIIRDNEEANIYKGEFNYSGDDLSFETFNYEDGEVYRIKHNWNKTKTINKIEHLDEPTKVEYTFDDNKFLLECLQFEYEGSVKKTLYEYKNDKLFKLIEFPHLEYKKTILGKIKIIEEAQFMNETEYCYYDNGLLQKEIIRDHETKEIVDIVHYDYE